MHFLSNYKIYNTAVIYIVTSTCTNIIQWGMLHGNRVQSVKRYMPPHIYPSSAESYDDLSWTVV